MLSEFMCSNEKQSYVEIKKKTFISTENRVKVGTRLKLLEQQQ